MFSRLEGIDPIGDNVQLDQGIMDGEPLPDDSNIVSKLII
jgi:hypothetical protein